MAKARGGSGLAYTASLDISQAMANSQKLMDQYKKLTLTANGVSTGGGDSANMVSAQGRITAAMRASLLETERLRQENIALQNQWQRGAITINELTARQRENTIARQQATAAARAARQAQVAVTGSYAEAQARLRTLGAEIRNAAGGFNNLGREQQARIQDYRQLNAQLTEFDRRMGNHQRNVGNYSSALKGIGGELAGLAATYVSAGAVIGGIVATFNQSLKADAVRTSLEFTFSSVDLADAKLEQLLKTANRLGVNYDALTTTYKSFTGAVIASNFSFTEGERIFNAVAGAAARLKLSSADTEGALRALQQMISKGNVQAEELRGQLGERIPGAFSIAARAMGVTESELNKLLQKGQVLAGDLLPKLATELEKTFDTNSTEQVEGLSAAVERLKNSFTGAVAENSNISKFFAGIVTGVEGAATAIFKLVNSNSWTEFFARVNSGDGVGDAIRNIADGYTKGQGSINKASALDIGAASAKTIRLTYEEVAISYKRASDALKEYQRRVADKSIIDEGKVTVANLTQVVDVLGSKMNQLKKFIPDEVAVKPGKSTAEIAAEKKAAREYDSALKARNSLQEKIDALTKKGTDKQLSADEQEIESVRDKYAKMLREAEKFNNDPKNKAKGLRVDGGRIMAASSREETALRDKQDTEKLKVHLDDQKKIYADFEDAKKKLGEDKAKERYANLIQADRTYLETLLQEEARLTDSQKGKGGVEDGDVSANQLKLKLVRERIADEKIAEQAKNDDIYADAYQAAMTSAQALMGIQAEYNLRVKALGDKATDEQIANLARERDAKIRSVNEQVAYERGGYQKLMEDWESMTTDAIRSRLQIIKDGYRKDYAEGKLNSEQLANLMQGVNQNLEKLDGSDPIARTISAIRRYKEALATLGKDAQGTKDAQHEMFSTLAEDAQLVSGAVGEIASSFSELGIGGEQLQKSLKDIQGVVEGAGQIAAGLASGNPVAVVTGSIKLLTSAISLFNNKDAKLQKQIDGYKSQLDSLGKAYKQLERDVANSVGESIYGDSAKQIDNLRKQAIEIAKMRDAESSKKKADAGKIAEYNAQLDAIPGQIEDIQKTINETLIQTNFRDLSNNLADAFSDAFAAGEDAAERFDDVFNKVIVNAVKNSLKLKILDPVIKKFTDDLAAYAGGNGNSILGFDFAAYKDKLTDAGKLFTAGLEGIKDFLPKDAAASVGNASPNSLQGQLTTASQESITILSGNLLGMRVAQLETNKTLLVTNNSLGELHASATQTLDATIKIEVNTRNTATNTAEMRDGILALNRKIDANAAAAKAAGF